MAREQWVGGIVGVAAAGYAIHGLVTDTGAAGWLNYLQQSMMGSYSMKLTVLGLTLGVFLVAGLAMLVTPASKAPTPSAASTAAMGPPAPSVTSWRSIGVLTVALVALTWAIGYGWHGWSVRTDREDARASYESVALDQATAPVASTHVALRGRMLTERRVEFSKGSGGSKRVTHYLVPVVGPGWSPGQPALYVMQVKQLVELSLVDGQVPIPRFVSGRRVIEPPPSLWLGRVEGAVPVPAVQEFRKLEVPLPDNARLVRLVPSRDGQPAVVDNSAEEFKMMLILCGGISVLVVFGLLFGGWSVRRGERRALAARGA